MGACDSSLQNIKQHNSKFSLTSDKEKKGSNSSTSLPNFSSIKFQKSNTSEINLKKYNSAQETNSLQDIQYIIPQKYAKREDITKKYKISKKVLGEGATSIVFLAEDSSKRKYAIKRIPKERIEYKKKIILKEAEICLILNNKNIIKCYEIYEDLNFISIVMEPADTDLFELIINSPLGYIPEEIAIDFLIQIFEVIDYLHSKVNIVHCDIKPENFVVKFNKKNGKPELKLIDFGNVRRKPLNKERLFNFNGTKEYMPPEALENSGFNEKADEWAAGIIMFNLLTGADPFISPNGDNENDYIDNIKFKEIKFQYIKNERLRELNKKLLNRFMVKRITAKDALIELKQIKKNLCLRDNINFFKNKDYDKNMNIFLNEVSYINMS